MAGEHSKRVVKRRASRGKLATGKRTSAERNPGAYRGDVDVDLSAGAPENPAPEPPRGTPRPALTKRARIGLQTMLGALPTAAYLTDSDGFITYYNAAAAELWGQEPVLGVTRWCGASRLYEPDGRAIPPEESPLAVVLRDGRPIDGRETAADRPDGARVWFLNHATPIKDARGRPRGAVNMLTDISVRKKLAIEASRLAAIVESSDDAIVSKDLDGIIMSWNAGAEHIFGYRASEIVGQPITRIIPPELIDEEARIIAALRRGDRINHFDTIRLARDGRRVDVSLTVSPIRDDAGDVVGASKVARDITQRRRAEEALIRAVETSRRAREEAESANGRLSRFAHAASHDIQEPLRKIVAFGDMLAAALDESNHADAAHACAVMRNSAQRARALVTNLLSLAQSVHGAHAPAPVAIRAVVDEALHQLAQAIADEGAVVKLAVTDFPIVADGSDAVRLVRNIVANALKFHKPDQAPVVEISSDPAARRLAIKDRGVGFPAGLGADVFAPLTRLRAAGEFPGDGIGLAICKAIADRHGWRLAARSTPGAGAVFEIGFPEGEGRRRDDA